MKRIGYYRRQLCLLFLMLCAIGLLKLIHVIRERTPGEAGKQQEAEDVRPMEELLLLGTWEEVEGLDQGEVLTDRGIYKSRVPLTKVLYRKASVILEPEQEEGQKVIAGIKDIREEEIPLNNIYILEARKDGISILYENYRVSLPGTIDGNYDYEHVADIVLKGGAVRNIKLKPAGIHGSILAVYDDKIELEGYGVLPLSEDFRIYEDYETPRELTSSQLVVGYDLAEFVVADGIVCAGIVKAPPDMTKIRVALNTTGYKGLYHQEIRIRPQCDVTVVTASGEETAAAGEELVFLPEYLDMEERIRLVPADEGAGMTVLSVERSQGTPSYMGTLEINRREEGLLLVNEVGLEAYLCSVVPSEMPASYEAEALKAQAVCARSYAYNQIRESKYQAYGAHVEDSVSSQVYNNVARQESTTRAVYETAGETAVYDGQVITAYYFSTSCGYTTTGGVWGDASGDIPYLQSKPVADEQGEDYEREESWYRWRTEADGKEYWDSVIRKTESLAGKNPGQVLVKQKDGTYQGGTVPKIGEITDIREGDRLEGGVLYSLYIDGTGDSVKILTEYAIRSILCRSGMEILKGDESQATANTLLPSGFFTLSLEKKNGRANRLQIEGGGYGHGVGMSQNGANRMAQQGMGYEEILKFFYEGIDIQKI